MYGSAAMVTFSSLCASCSGYVLAWFAGGGLKCFSPISSVVNSRTQPMMRAAFTN